MARALNKYVASHRGINVGGKNVIAKGDLRDCFENLGFTDVRTYIQSGNILFRCEESAVKKLASRVEAVEGGDRVGDNVTISFGERWKVVMQRTETIQNQRVRYQIASHDTDEWLGTELVFDLSEIDGWTTLKFDQRGWKEPSDFFRFCSVKWGVFLLSIKQAIETGVGTPSPNETKIGRMD